MTDSLTYKRKMYSKIALIEKYLEKLMYRAIFEPLYNV